MKPHRCSVEEQEAIKRLLRDLDERIQVLGRQHHQFVERPVGRALSDLQMAHVVSQDEHLDVETYRPTLRNAAAGDTVDRYEFDKGVGVARSFLTKHPPSVGG